MPTADIAGPASDDAATDDPAATSPPASRPRRLGRFEWLLLAIAFAGLVFRVGYVVVTRGDDSLCGQRLCGDAIYYSAQADRLGEGRGFRMLRADLVWEEAADHAPLTALVMAPVSALTGDRDPITYQRLTMALVGFVVILAIGFLGRRVARGRRHAERVGLIAAAIAAVNANLWMNDVIVMSEALAAWGVALTLLATYRFIDAPTRRRAAVVGACIGFAALARAELAMMGVVMFVPVALWVRAQPWATRVGRIAVAGVCAAAMLAPWTLYNLSRFEEPVVMSTNDGLTLLGANCADVYGLDGTSGGLGFWSLDCALRLGDQLPPGGDQSVVSGFYRDQGVEFVLAHKHRWRDVAEMRLLKGWGFYAPEQMVWLNKGEGRTPWASWTGIVQWWLLVPAAVVGGVLLRRRGRSVWPLASMFVVVTITVLGFYGIIRFRIAADVAATVLAAVALDALWTWWRNRPVGEVAARAGIDDAGEQAVFGSGTASSPVEAAEALVRTPPAPEEVVPARHGPTHFPCLDAYRGIGMTMVLLNHAAYSTGYLSREGSVAQFLTPFIARLDLSVPMFFVMSGFLLYRPFAKATLTERDLPDLRLFYRRRVLRILPAYWVALALIGLVVGLHVSGVTGWVGNALLLPAVGVPVETCAPGGNCHAAYGLTQAWSIGVEATFYLTLPLFAALVHRLARRRDSTRNRLVVVLGSLALLYALGTAFRAVVVAANPPWAEQSLLWLPMFTDLFAIGMALAAISAAVSLERPLPRLLGWLGDHPVLAWAIAGAVFLVVTRMTYPAQPFGLRDADGSSDYLPRQFLYGIASAVWLAPAIFGDQSRGVLRRVLRSRPLVYLGAISLSFYLWHLVVIDRVKAWTVPDYLAREAQAANPRPGNALDGLATFTGSYAKVVVIAWVVSFIIASISYRFVELPFLRLKDRPLHALWRDRDPDGNRPVADAAGAGAASSAVDADGRGDERSDERINA